MFFFREHLIGKDYEWPENKNSQFFGTPGRQVFDRFNGNHLLYIINVFGESIGKLSIDDGQKIEMLISQLPFNLKSELSVFNWLKGKYLYYWN